MVNDGTIAVNHGELTAAAQHLDEAARRIEARLEQLHTDLSPLRAQWTGNARTEYDRRKLEWDEAADAIRRIIKDAGTGVQTSNEGYARADAQGRDLFLNQ